MGRKKYQLWLKILKWPQTEHKIVEIKDKIKYQQYQRDILDDQEDTDGEGSKNTVQSQGHPDQ